MALIQKTTVKYLIRKYIFAPAIWAGNALAHLFYGVTPRRWWQLDRPIFVVGCPRSGTTIFEELFREHEELVSWTEAGQIFQPRYYNPDVEHLMEAEDLTRFDAARIRVFFKIRTLLAGKPRFVNKNPRNSLRISYLRALYPDAVFIHIIRDGRAVVNSNETVTRKTPFRRKLPFGGFCKPPNWRTYRDMPITDQFAHQWIEIVKYILAKKDSELDADRYIEARYEDFCEDTRGVLAKLDAFCGLDPHRRRIDRIPARLEAQNAKWRNTFDEHKIEKINSIAREGLERYQYAI